MTLKAQPKRPQVGVNFEWPLYEEITEAAKSETTRGEVAPFVLDIFLYGYQVYRRVRSLKALRELREELETLSPGAELPQLAASRETYAELLAALGLILERAPATVVEEVAALLTDRAGKYATPALAAASSQPSARARAEQAAAAAREATVHQREITRDRRTRAQRETPPARKPKAEAG